MNKFAEFIKSVATEKVDAMARLLTEDPLQGFMFRLSIPGIEDNTIGFQQVGDLNREVEVIEYLENMYEHAHKLPGRESVGEVTLSKGMYAGTEFKDVYEACILQDDFRQEVTLNILDRLGSVRRSFGFAEAWFSAYNVSGIDATSSDVIIEELTMQFEYFTNI